MADNSVDVRIRKLAASDLHLLEAMLTLFGEAFEEPDTYGAARPGRKYASSVLGNDLFVALVAMKGEQVVGGLAAYELPKFEQERSEYYIYDLAVDRTHRRHGIATALIDELRKIAAGRGAYVIFVQADYADQAAIALYSKLGVREDVIHFDIAVDP